MRIAVVILMALCFSSPSFAEIHGEAKKQGHPVKDQIATVKDIIKTLAKEGVVIEVKLTDTGAKAAWLYDELPKAIVKNPLISYATIKGYLGALESEGAKALEGKDPDIIRGDELVIYTTLQMVPKIREHLAKHFDALDRLTKAEKDEFADLVGDMRSANFVMPQMGITTKIGLHKNNQMSLEVRSDRDPISVPAATFRDRYTKAYDQVKAKGWDRFFVFPQLIEKQVELLKKL